MLLKDSFREQFEETRDALKMRAKEQILKTQEENRKMYNLRRRKSIQYKLDDLMAIKRTQLGPGRKLCAKYLGPYRITMLKLNDTYDVQRTLPGEGPMNTSIYVEFMKLWSSAKRSG